MDAIGSDHEPTRNLPLPIVTVFDPHARHATVVRADQIDELRFERDLRAGLSRSIDKNSVKNGPPRCVETLHSWLRFDLHGNHLVGVMKRRRSDDRRAGRLDCFQNAPTRELEHAGTHECMGRDCIAPVVAAVDREHTKTSPREEQRGGRAGATGSDNDDVEINRWGRDAGNISNDVWRLQVVPGWEI